jgi:trimeric autotransporter adhesin
VPLNGAATSYAFTHPVTAAALPAGVGANRTTQTQTGWFGGTLNSTATTSPYAAAGTVTLNTNAATNGVAATFAGAPVSPTAAGGVTNITMQYGGQGAQQAFVDNNNFGAAESVASTQQMTVNGAPVTPNGQLYMVSSATAPPPQSLLPNGASYCDCQFLQWGYWGGDLTSANGTANPRVDRGHINTWIAGQPTSPADIAALQSASLNNAQAAYAGHAIGSVANNGLQYVAAGAFNGSYNFSSQQMNLAITNFDGHNFNGITALGGKTPVTVNAAGSNSYTLPVNNTPGFGGTFNGTFYGPQAANTGGNFSVQSTAGPSYAASGIFAGKR